MKQKLLLTVLALGMCSTIGFAQKKEYHVEDDGFEWYELSNYSDGHFYSGVQDKFGKTIIPIQEITIYYDKEGYFRIKPSEADFSERNGLVDKEGHLIVPMEYCDAAFYKGNDRDHYIGNECDLPYIAVTGKGTFGIYSIYGKCLIPISRRYAYVSPRGKAEKMYWLCEHQMNSPKKYSLCDASGKEFFTTSKAYSECVLIRHPTNKTYALVVRDPSGHCSFIDKDEKILLDPYYADITKWPIRIKTIANGTMRNLTQAEVNKVFFSANWLDGNSEYFAHASEYPMYKIGEKPSSNSTASSNTGSNSSNNPGGGTTTVVVEHHRDQVPVQEWQQCPACYGSGQCPNVQCGGSGWYYIGDKARTCSRCHGSGKCTICAGKGGQYVTVYR